MSSESVLNNAVKGLSKAWTAFQEELFDPFEISKNLFLGCLLTSILEENGLLPRERNTSRRLTNTNLVLAKFGIERVPTLSSMPLQLAERTLHDLTNVVEALDIPPYRILSLAYDWFGRLGHRKSGIHRTSLDVVNLMCKLAICPPLSRKLGLNFEETIPFLNSDTARSKLDSVKHVLCNTKIVDPASGSGEFLHGIIDIAEELGAGLENPRELTRRILPNLFAVEIDSWGARLTKLGLLLRFKEDLGSFSQINVYQGDYLLPGILERIGPTDVVIGNPPYIRNELVGKITSDDLDGSVGLGYKERLYHEVRQDWPVLRLDRGADLYVYFFLKGLHHLRQNGTLCLVTSNSWLDSNYGVALQEWLTVNSRILCILGWTERSFEADIDPAITLVTKSTRHSPQTPEQNLTEVVRFLRLPRPSFSLLERLLSSNGGDIRPASNEELSLVSIPQRVLYEEILRHEETWVKSKWGGRFLRAPKIYRQIFESLRDRFVPLGQIARVKSGIHSRANDFFILRKAPVSPGTPLTKALVFSQLAPKEIPIEKRFLREIVTSPRLYPCILVDHTDYFVLDINLPKESIKELAVSRYIELGEQAGIPKRPELSRRGSRPGSRAWYSVFSKEPGPILVPKITRDNHRAHYNPGLLLADGNFYSLIPSHADSTKGLLLYLNGSLAALSREVIGRTNVLGALKVEGMDWSSMPVPNLTALEEIADLFGESEVFIRRQIQPIESEIMLTDRRALDEIVSNVLDIGSPWNEIYSGLVGIRKLRGLKEQRN